MQAKRHISLVRNEYSNPAVCVPIRSDDNSQRASRSAQGSEAGFAGGGAKNETFEDAVLVHLDAAYRLARYLTRRSDIAEDVVQDAILRAFRSFDSRRGDNTRAWFLTIVRNCFLTFAASHRHKQEALYPADEFEAFVKADEDGKDLETPEVILLRHEESDTIRAHVESLPHPFREVLVLKEIEDMSYRDIAEITGVPIGTVMSRLARARKMFAAAWTVSQMKTSKVSQ